MSVISNTFQKIYSLNEISQELETPLAEGEWGILSFDFDQTLVEGAITLGNEHFYRFMMEMNRDSGRDPDAHYHWTAKVREKVTYKACEEAIKVNCMIEQFRRQGWSVNILTSRGMTMQQSTDDHLKQAQLILSLSDVIFKRVYEDESGKLIFVPKDASLYAWMQQQHQWHEAKAVRILFLDDSERYCEEVARIINDISKPSQVRCYHYTGALPNGNLSQKQLENLIIELHFYQTDKGWPLEYSESILEEAKCALGIVDIKKETVYQTIIDMIENR